MWEIAENLHRFDLTKEQRDEHIRRYADLLEARKQVSPQTAAQPKSGPQGGRPKSIAREVAEATGLSDDTVRRALNPKPREIVSVKEAETAEEAIIRESVAIRTLNSDVAVVRRVCGREAFQQAVRPEREHLHAYLGFSPTREHADDRHKACPFNPRAHRHERSNGGAVGDRRYGVRLAQLRNHIGQSRNTNPILWCCGGDGCRHRGGWRRRGCLQRN